MGNSDGMAYPGPALFGSGRAAAAPERPGVTAMILRSSRTRLLLFGLVVSLMLVPRRAPGTVAEQRQRLPPAAECNNEVEGRWKAHVFDSSYHDWHVFTLEVHRVPGNPSALRGTIQVEGWDGGPTDQEPPACKGHLHFTGHMPAEGRFEGGKITFSGKQWNLDTLLCGRFGGYALDNFSGVIDQKTQEFQSVNDDHNRGEQATVFRRISCFEDGGTAGPEVRVTPPPLFPDKPKVGGCGC